MINKEIPRKYDFCFGDFKSKDLKFERNSFAEIVENMFKDSKILLNRGNYKEKKNVYQVGDNIIQGHTEYINTRKILAHLDNYVLFYSEKDFQYIYFRNKFHDVGEGFNNESSYYPIGGRFNFSIIKDYKLNNSLSKFLINSFNLKTIKNYSFISPKVFISKDPNCFFEFEAYFSEGGYSRDFSEISLFGSKDFSAQHEKELTNLLKCCKGCEKKELFNLFRKYRY